MASPSDNLIERDRAHVWHPYSSFASDTPLYPVASAEGVTLTLTDGRQLIDGMASWWSVLHGYNHPRLNQALLSQSQAMSHVMFGGLTHEPAVALCEKLVTLTPTGLNKVFLSDSGSVSVEVAMKMALQYWQSQNRPGRHRFVALKNGYHGDTFGAMSVCDPVTGMHHLFAQNLMQQLFAERPQSRFHETFNPDDINSIRDILACHHHEVAAVILEPVVQGAGGMWMYSPEYLRQVRALCDQYDVLLIADEIATGFGRTGKLFACEHAGISPDLMCLGKTLTGGYMTLAATLCTDKVSDGICRGSAGVFMHGPTFMGNPLACAVACASIDLLLESDWQRNIARIERQLMAELEPCRGLENVSDVRVLGGIGVVELKQAPAMTKIQPAFVEEGIWVRPFGKLVYIMPPYIASEQEIRALTSGIYRVVSAL